MRFRIGLDGRDRRFSTVYEVREFFERGRWNRMTMRNATPSRRRRDVRRSRMLLVAAGFVLFAGLFMQITMLARISSQSKTASSLESEIEELAANAENLELNINQYHNLDSIRERARELGMDQPDETQIRVVNVARSNVEDTSTQAAGNVGAESILN